MKLKDSILLPMLLALFEVTSAQTVQWAVHPISAQLENYGQLFKVRKNGKTGLIDHDNNSVIPMEYDSITAFRNGYALLLNKRGDRMKIEAVVSDEDYEIQPVSSEVYATNYLWFNEGKMPVEGKGGWGYLGTDGNMSIPCQFQIAYPFSEGYASVKMKDKAYYITRDMDYLKIEKSDWGLVFASTFSGGEAVVYTSNMKGYVINRKGRIIRSYKIKAQDVKPNKVDHSIGDKTRMYNDQVAKLEIDESYSVFKENNLYGYKKGGQTIVPAQFDNAELVRGNYANVRFKGQNGVIRFVKNNINIYITDSDIEVIAGSIDNGSFQLSLPEEMEDANIQIKLKDTKGRDLIAQSNTNQGTKRTYRFKPLFAPYKSEATEGHLEIWSEDLIIRKASFKMRYAVTTPSPIITPKESEEEKPAVKPVLSIASFTVADPRKTAEKANPSDVFFITVTVSNSGDERGNANVVLFVDGKRVGDETINVKGHGMANAIIGVPNVKKERWSIVKATLANNGKSSEETEIHFLPFY